jgi:hypothetical protein
MNHVDFIIAAEEGNLSEEEVYAGLQKMIDDGTVWHLQGSWQRAAQSAIESGACTPKGASSK